MFTRSFRVITIKHSTNRKDRNGRSDVNSTFTLIHFMRDNKDIALEPIHQNTHDSNKAAILTGVHSDKFTFYFIHDKFPDQLHQLYKTTATLHLVLSVFSQKDSKWHNIHIHHISYRYHNWLTEYPTNNWYPWDRNSYCWPETTEI